MSTAASGGADAARETAIANYRKKFLEHRELETRLKKSTNTAAQKEPSSQISTILALTVVLLLTVLSPPSLSAR